MDESRAVGTLILERYRVEELLGVGGMAAVYRVRDEQHGSSLALKELHSTSDREYSRRRSNFEREYHSLVQLQHPSIVEVYDYGVDERGHPFYTMELLDGEDLRQRVAPTWEQACALLRDVASSLAILHSRRLLHRDISARNIRCTSNGRAKLIDFGGMTPMGVLKHVVGTPPFVPPEALQMQALDGRSDLFSLGALFYWLMTRRHAYPARNLAELPDLWRTPVASPRQYDADLPPALDQLIMQLLQLDRDARPSRAGEVIERLCGIANLPLDERAAVSAAYLATPVLVGREALLQRVRALHVDARRGRGSVVLIEDAPGSGRSRVLDACVLDAKLLGAVVVRGDPADSADGDYGVARSLAEQLFSALPRLARRCAASRTAALAHVLPQLSAPRGVSLPVASGSVWPSLRAHSSLPHVTAAPESVSGIGSDSGSPVSDAPPTSAPPLAATGDRRQVQAALRDFVLAVAREKHLVVAVDDVDAIDEPSAALLTLLAHAAPRRKLTLVMSAPRSTSDSDGTGSALALLRKMAQRITLPPLTTEQSEMLLRSVFGDVPNLATVSARIHHIAGGNPRWTMELAEHLVSRGLARYETGSWALPATLATGDVPASLTERLTARLSELPADALDLAEALALTDPGLIAVSAYSRLTEHGDLARTYDALSDLVAGGILVAAAESYLFSHDEMASLVRGGLTPERARTLHGRIAGELRRDEHPLQLADHQLLGGFEHEGIRLVLELSDDAVEHPPGAMLALVERALDCAEQIGEPEGVRLILRSQLLFGSATQGDYARFMSLLPQVRDCVLRQTGLADYDELGEIADPMARAREALRRAGQRHDETPECLRGYAPQDAFKALGYTWLSCSFMAGIAQELAFVKQLPSVTPLMPFAPALLITDQIVELQRALQSGRQTDARKCTAGLLREADGPAYRSQTPMQRALGRAPLVYLLGLFDALLGKDTALTYMKELDLPRHRSNAWRVRMVYELMRGRSEAAAASQRRAELFALQDSGSVTLPGTTLRTELRAAIYADDLLAVKRCMERSETLAARYPGWRSTLAIARAHYRRLQGDLNAALIAAEQAVALAPAGRHIDWCEAASIQLDVLTELGRGDEAFAMGRAFLDTARREGLAEDSTPLFRSVAECCLRIGRLQNAMSMADRYLASQLERGARGLQLGRAYETRARVAIAMRDEPGLERYAQLCAAEYKGSRNPLLSHKYQVLLREADAAGARVLTGQRGAADFSSDASAYAPMQTLRSRLLRATHSDEPAQQVLELLVEAHDATAGYLFSTRDGRLELLAASVMDQPSLELVRTLEGYIAELSAPEPAKNDEEEEEVTAFLSIAFEAVAGEATRAVSTDGFEPLPLFAESGSRRVLVALAALRFDEGRRRAVPESLLSAFSEALIQPDLA